LIQVIITCRADKIDAAGRPQMSIKCTEPFAVVNAIGMTEADREKVQAAEMEYLGMFLQNAFKKPPEEKQQKILIAGSLPPNLQPSAFAQKRK
jgi:hypothetical protein